MFPAFTCSALSTCALIGSEAFGSDLSIGWDHEHSLPRGASHIAGQRSQPCWGLGGFGGLRSSVQHGRIHSCPAPVVRRAGFAARGGGRGRGNAAGGGRLLQAQQLEATCWSPVHLGRASGTSDL